MIFLAEDKQIGDLSYYVSSIDVFEQILKTSKIARSRVKEFNADIGKSQFYVSFSRNLTAAPIRNGKRWRFGIIVDGTKLSNRYKFTPISYVGTKTEFSNILVKDLIMYDDNTYYMSFVGWKKFQIPESLYDKIERAIMCMPDIEKTKNGLIVQDFGKRLVNGRKIKKKYTFDKRYGGMRVTSKEFPEITSFISKLQTVNEYEERIWLDT